MRPKRTIRRPTRWTPDEWHRVEVAARARSIPAARFVLEAVLSAVRGGAPAQCPQPEPIPGSNLLKNRFPPPETPNPHQRKRCGGSTGKTPAPGLEPGTL